MTAMKPFLARLLRDGDFFRSLLTLSLPVALQNLLISGLNMVDTVMIGRLGEKAIAAVALSNQIYFLMILLFFGIASGTSVFTAQYWGKGDSHRIHEALGFCLIAVSAGATVFGLAALFMPERLLGFFTEDGEVIRLGADYLRVVAPSYWFTAVSFAYANVLRSVGIVRMPLYTTAFALGLNTLGNYLLIFGYWGFPALGVEGSALATVVARTVEAMSLVWAVYRFKTPAASALRELFSISGEYVRKFFRTALPVILNEFIWALGMTMYSVVYARMGTEALASYTIADTIAKFALVLFFGTSNACAVMVGNRIGAGELDKARYYAYAYALLGPALGAVMGFLVVLARPLLPLAFTVSSASLADAEAVVLVFAFSLPAKIFGWHLVVGILRSGGDTRFSLALEGLGVWCIGVPLALFSGLVLRLPVYWVYAAISVEEAVKALIGYYRLRSGKWIHRLTHS